MDIVIPSCYHISHLCAVEPDKKSIKLYDEITIFWQTRKRF